jgi:hypothetical protein
MTSAGGAQNFKSHADNFMFAVLPDTPFHQVFIIPDGAIHLRDGANSQSSLFVVYADLLLRTGQYVLCRNQPRQPVPDTDSAHDMHVGVHRRLAGGRARTPMSCLVLKYFSNNSKFFVTSNL